MVPILIQIKTAIKITITMKITILIMTVFLKSDDSCHQFITVSMLTTEVTTDITLRDKI